jgi:hypothetical protein
VNVKKTFVAFCIAIAAGFCGQVCAADYFTDRGSFWAGGAFSYQNENIRGQSDPVTMTMVSPTLRFFPAKYFLLSQAFSWWTTSQTDPDNNGYSYGMFTFGPEAGFAFGKNMPVVPYVISGALYAHSYSSSSYMTTDINGNPITDTRKSGADGYQVPLLTGVMIKLFDGLGIQVELGFSYIHIRGYTAPVSTSDLSTVSISVGVCGIGSRSAVSMMMNTYSGFMAF